MSTHRQVGEIDWLAIERAIRAELRSVTPISDRIARAQALVNIDAVLGSKTGRGYEYSDEMVNDFLEVTDNTGIDP